MGFCLTTPVVDGMQYDETNANQATGMNYMDFRIGANAGPDVTCPAGAGSGSLLFDRLMFWPNQDGGFTSGAYTFSCPDAGLSVQGCFAYH